MKNQVIGDYILKHYNLFYPIRGHIRYPDRFYPAELNIEKQKNDLFLYSFLYDKTKLPPLERPSIENYFIDINRYYIDIKDVYDYLDSWKAPYDKYKKKIIRIKMIVEVSLAIICLLIGGLLTWLIGWFIVIYFIWMFIVYVLYKLWERFRTIIITKIDDNIGIALEYKPQWKIACIKLFINEFNLVMLSYKVEMKKQDNLYSYDFRRSLDELEDFPIKKEKM